jgi:hypothetical protein
MYNTLYKITVQYLALYKIACTVSYIVQNWYCTMSVKSFLPDHRLRIRPMVTLRFRLGLMLVTGGNRNQSGRELPETFQANCECTHTKFMQFLIFFLSRFQTTSGLRGWKTQWKGFRACRSWPVVTFLSLIRDFSCL